MGFGICEGSDKREVALGTSIFFCCGVFIHWRVKQTPSNKLGGEMFISSRACMFVTIYMLYIRPDNQFHAHSHLLNVTFL